MIPVWFKFVRALLLGACLALICAPLASRAAFEADPQKLYQEMKAAYDKGNAEGWTFFDQEYYFSTIVNAGRAYSLQRPDDPAYGQLCQLTVDVGTGLHYNPLTNHDAAAWYVREAATWVMKNVSDPDEVAKAKALLESANAIDDPTQLVQIADQGATANLKTYPRDQDALLQRIEAEWRGYLLTKDPSWRSLALEHANSPYFPIGNLPTTWGPGFVNMLLNASHGVDGYTQGDQTNAEAVLTRLKAVNPLLVIASVKGVPHDLYLTTLAPADEYFGPMGMSVLGIKNELKRINKYLDFGYGDRESSMAVQVAVSIDDMHKVYPRDRDLPTLLLECYKTLGRLHTSDAAAAADHLRALLTVEYQDSPQARSLLAAS